MNVISVIVPIFHGKKYIKGLIKQMEDCAVRLQGDKEARIIELILVNDAPDEKIENQNSMLCQITVYNTDHNRGIHGARVFGLSRSNGQYVLFLDQDDSIFPDYFSRQVQCIQHGDASVCRCIHEKKQLYNADFRFEEVITKEHMLTQGCPIISPGQVLLRKSSIPEVWKENIMMSNCADDYLLWLCMTAQGCRFVLNQDILFEHTVDEENLSLDYKRMILSENEMYEILKNNKVFNEKDLCRISAMLKKVVFDRFALLEKFRKMFMVLNKVMACREAGYPVGGHLKLEGIHTAAIYGDSYLGKRLMGELEGYGIKVAFFIDRNADYLEEKVPVYTLEDAPDGVDAVIISMVQNFKTVMVELKKKYHIKIFTISEIVEEIFQSYEIVYKSDY